MRSSRQASSNSKAKIGVSCARTCEQLPATPPLVEFETRAKRLTRSVVSATPGPNSTVAEADLAKAFVLACIGKLIANGFAEWTVLETGDVRLTLNAGETFLLADTSIIRIS